MVGAFVPGESISLRKLAETLKTSLMPVREAVNRLIAERAFESLPNRKVIVPYLSEEKLTELMYWRKVLESSRSTRSSCRRSPTMIFI